MFQILICEKIEKKVKIFKIIWHANLLYCYKSEKKANMKEVNIKIYKFDEKVCLIADGSREK